MAIKERKQITGTEAQIKAFAGHEGVLAYATDTKRLHVLSGTAGQTTELANKGDIPPAVDISGKADKTYVDEQVNLINDSLYEKASKSEVLRDEKSGSVVNSLSLDDSAMKVVLKTVSNTPGLPGTQREITSFYTSAAADHKFGVRIPPTGDRGQLAGFESVAITDEISDSSPDTSSNYSDNIQIKNGSMNKSWTKVCALMGSAPVVTLDGAFTWAGGKAPELTTFDILVVHWNTSFGLVSVVKSVS